MDSPKDFSYLYTLDKSYLDDLYEKYKAKAADLDPSWRQFFLGLEYAQALSPLPGETEKAKAQVSGPDVTPADKGLGLTGTNAGQFEIELKIYRWIQAFRARGHLLSTTNPVRPRKDRKAQITLQDFGLDGIDPNQTFQMGAELNIPNATLKQIKDRLNVLYTGDIGIEYMHITNQVQRNWIRENYEARAHSIDLPLDQKKRVLRKLNEATVFENFLGTKYVGQKRFSLEGGENTVPALDAIIQKSAALGVNEIVIGMAHRGRLNILANIMGKTYEYIFSEFEGQNAESFAGDGDVKYHLGYSTETQTESGKKVHLTLMYNPSHLETVAPVVSGFARGKTDLIHGNDHSKALPIILHGDAAVAGQGVVYEMAQMSKLPGYSTMGSIHFVINNQIGFTTGFEDGRSSIYCTDVAKAIDAPVIHVNGDNAEAVVFAVEFAVEYRQTFGQDIYIDMVCYRRHGHNEADEPSFTQPKLYKIIKSHAGPREVYLQKLLAAGKIETELAQKLEKEFQQLLLDRFNMVKQKPLPRSTQYPIKAWDDMRPSTPLDFETSPNTAVPLGNLQAVLAGITSVPKDFHLLSKTKKLIETRLKQFEENHLDWGLAELLAYGTILLDNHDVRLSGQDVIRGTFSHRHAEFFDEENDQAYCGLNHIREKQGTLHIYNSLLSEYAVMGFEYGHALAYPHTLTIWEAQFGDFSNGAQIVIDQFISSAESKWGLQNGLTLLLPHGYEGQGPEHSSARTERYLQLSSEFNILVTNPTTPANLFHALRRQLAYPFRKPLIVFTPKSLLRHPLCISHIEDLTEGKFQEVIGDAYVEPKKVKRVLLCSGKIFYDLYDRQQMEKRTDVAIIRLEQLHPIPFTQLMNVLKPFSGAEVLWVQEEPKNMGYWNHVFGKLQFERFDVIARKSSASPATGFSSRHKKEQEEIIKKAFLIN